MNHRARNEQQNVLTRTPTETTPSTPINSVYTCSATGQEKIADLTLTHRLLVVSRCHQLRRLGNLAP